MSLDTFLPPWGATLFLTSGAATCALIWAADSVVLFQGGPLVELFVERAFWWFDWRHGRLDQFPI